MNTPNEERRPLARAAASSPISAATKPPQDHQQPNRAARRGRPVVARSVAYRPGAGRTYWLHLVLLCPFACGFVHHHRGAAHGGLRRARCGRGSYMLTPVAGRLAGVA